MAFAGLRDITWLTSVKISSRLYDYENKIAIRYETGTTVDVKRNEKTERLGVLLVPLSNEELNAKRKDVKNSKLIETKKRNKNNCSVIIQSSQFMPLLLEY